LIQHRWQKGLGCLGQGITKTCKEEKQTHHDRMRGQRFDTKIGAADRHSTITQNIGHNDKKYADICVEYK
jgi:hypothetical protein